MSTSCVQFRRAWVEGRTEKGIRVHRAEKVYPSDVQVGTVSWRGWGLEMGVRGQSGLPARRHQFGHWAGDSGTPNPAPAQPVLSGSLRGASAFVKKESWRGPVLPHSPPWSGRSKERASQLTGCLLHPHIHRPCCWPLLGQRVLRARQEGGDLRCPWSHCSLDMVWAGLLRSWRSKRCLALEKFQGMAKCGPGNSSRDVVQELMKTHILGRLLPDKLNQELVVGGAWQAVFCLAPGDSDARLSLRTTGLRKVQYRHVTLQKGVIEAPQGSQWAALQSHCFIGEYRLLILGFWRVSIRPSVTDLRDLAKNESAHKYIPWVVQESIRFLS